jgi:hypothetical protein
VAAGNGDRERVAAAASRITHHLDRILPGQQAGIPTPKDIEPVPGTDPEAAS